LAIAILQFFPKFSTISPGLVILPLLAVLAITALKDGYEDIKRHQADHRVNHSIIHVLGGEGYENHNIMAPKDKTFIPGIPLPRKWSKKAKKGKKGDAQIAGQLEEEPAVAVPTGNTIGRVRSQADNVSTWEDDPNAADDTKELGWHRTIWEDVKVGDIVKIYDNEQIPAGRSDVECADNRSGDLCYIGRRGCGLYRNEKSRWRDESQISTCSTRSCSFTDH